jgi:ribonucleoside-diphosphate reductase alpha chain
VPDRFKYADHNTIKNFLRGLFTANGSVISIKNSKQVRVNLKASSKQIIEDVQLMLSSVGINSYYTTSKSKQNKFSNGTYTVKESYDLAIIKDADKFCKSIGFIQKYKQNKLEEYLKLKHNSNNVNKYTYDIKNVEYIGDEEVYDIMVDNTNHTFWYDGFNIANCGEQYLSFFDSCRLLSINLYSFVDNPFTDHAKFNYKLLSEKSKLAARIMDDLIDLELESIDRIIEKIHNDPEEQETKQPGLNLWNRIKQACKNGRRMGIGITGLADCLAALNIKYDTNGGIDIIDKGFQEIKYSCYEQSIELGKTLGTFPDWKKNTDNNCPFFLRFKEDNRGKKIYNNMMKYGRRNIAILTCAPSGTISCLTQTSSGIEPVFQLEYKRRKKIVANDKNIKVDFVDDVGEKWQEFTMVHPKVKEWQKITNKTDINKSPWYNCCANDINWKKRVEMQQTIQKHVCNSISSTINLPEDTSVETVQDIYTAAWKAGLKGITVYRQNSRSGVLLDKSQKDGNIIMRPKRVPCDVHHTSVGGKPYFVLVGLLDGQPYEIFAGKNKGLIKNSIKTGEIVKKCKGFYKAMFEDDNEISPITATSSDIEETITRLASACLRAKIDLDLLTQQLEKVGGDNAEMHTFSKALVRVLKKYIVDGTIVKGEVCPECGSKLIRKEGCWGCESCIYTKCQ